MKSLVKNHKDKFNKNTFWENTTGTFAFIDESNDFDTLLLKAVKEYANREAVAHFNKSKTVFWVRYEDRAYRIAESASYGKLIGDNCLWQLDKDINTIKKYCIAEIQYKTLKINQ